MCEKNFEINDFLGFEERLSFKIDFGKISYDFKLNELILKLEKEEEQIKLKISEQKKKKKKDGTKGIF